MFILKDDKIVNFYKFSEKLTNFTWPRVPLVMGILGKIKSLFPEKVVVNNYNSQNPKTVD